MNARETISGESSSAPQQAEEGGGMNSRQGTSFHEQSPVNDGTTASSSTPYACPSGAAGFPVGIHAQRIESRRVRLASVLDDDGHERLRILDGPEDLGLATSSRPSAALREAEELIRQRAVPVVPTGGQASAVVTDDSDNGSSDGGDDEVVAKPGTIISGGGVSFSNKALFQTYCEAAGSPPAAQKGEQRYALLTRAIDSKGNAGCWIREGSMVTRVTSAPTPSVEQQEQPPQRSTNFSVGAVGVEETLTELRNDSDNFLAIIGDAGLFSRGWEVS